MHSAKQQFYVSNGTNYINYANFILMVITALCWYVFVYACKITEKINEVLKLSYIKIQLSSNRILVIRYFLHFELSLHYINYRWFGACRWERPPYPIHPLVTKEEHYRVDYLHLPWEQGDQDQHRILVRRLAMGRLQGARQLETLLSGRSRQLEGSSRSRCLSMQARCSLHREFRPSEDQGYEARTEAARDPFLRFVWVEREVTRLIFKYFSFKNCHIAIPASNLSDYKTVRDMAILYF